MLCKLAITRGGVDVSGDGARLTAEACRFIECTNKKGGAVTLDKSASGVFVECEFDKNKATARAHDHDESSFAFNLLQGS